MAQHFKVLAKNHIRVEEDFTKLPVDLCKAHPHNDRKTKQKH